MFTQLTLPIRVRDEATFTNFYFAENENLLQALSALLQNKINYLYVWGTPGVGCSHLLQACCHEANQLGLSSAYIPLADNHGLNPSLLDDLEKMDLVCIDDIDAIAGKAHWEESIFHLFNRLSTQNQRLLISARHVPKALNLSLPDLTTRLMNGLIFPLRELSDQNRLLALQLRAKLRGLELPNEVGEFLLHRVERNLTALFQILEKLDQASLATQKKLTIPFIKQVLAI